MILFFFNDTATTEIYTLSLHDALPIFPLTPWWAAGDVGDVGDGRGRPPRGRRRATEGEGSPSSPLSPLGKGTDRKSTRLNSSHANISYAVFCLKKKTHQ